MKIAIIKGEVQTMYELPDSFNLMFGDPDGMDENRFDAVGRITNTGTLNLTLQKIRDDYDGMNNLSVVLYSGETPVYTQSFNRLVYTFSSSADEPSFVESLFFAS